MRLRWLLIVLSLSLSLASCSTCRETSIRDAEKYAAQGQQSRIACYYLNLDGLLWGGFVWKSHCQAQVRVADEWRWIGEFGGLRKEPTFRPRGEVFTWTIEGYKQLLKDNGR
jgi:hypothetical protein